MALGKRGKKARQGIDRNAFYALEKAVDLIKTGATAKFNHWGQTSTKAARIIAKGWVPLR